MKKILFCLVLILIMGMMLSSVCFALETETAEAGYSNDEQDIADGLSGALQKGDEIFSGRPWWDSFSTLVRDNMSVIVTAISGAIAFVGSLLLWKSRTKIREYISGLGKALKDWLSVLKTELGEIKSSTEKLQSDISKVKRELEKIKKADVLTVDALEDMIKLSGADEGKKDIYIMQVEKAKAAIDDEK